MFYLIYGEDSKKSEEKFSSLIDGLIAKKPAGTFFKVDDESFDLAQFEELVLGQTLFDKKYIVACRRVFNNKLACEFIEAKAGQIADSPHIFVFYDEKIPTEILKKIKLKAAKVQEFSKLATKNSKTFNIFSLGDALGVRDRKKLWLNFTQALHFGIPVEEIFWQFSRTIKNILLVKKTDDYKSLGLHPFVLAKTQKFSNNFETEELSNLSTELVKIFHEVRDGKREMDIALERFVMEV